MEGKIQVREEESSYSSYLLSTQRLTIKIKIKEKESNEVKSDISRRSPGRLKLDKPRKSSY